MAQPEFKEQQHFRQWWLWLLLLGLTAIPLVGIYQQLILGQPFGENPMSDVGLLFFAVFILLLLIGFFYFRLTTEVNSKGIRVSFFPLATRMVDWNEIEKVEFIQYKALSLGIRISLKYGMIYNTQRGDAVFITLKNDDKLLIGTQQQVGLKQALKQGLEK